jgi:hypothetical protein
MAYHIIIKIIMITLITVIMMIMEDMNIAMLMIILLIMRSVTHHLHNCLLLSTKHTYFYFFTTYLFPIFCCLIWTRISGTRTTGICTQIPGTRTTGICTQISGRTTGTRTRISGTRTRVIPIDGDDVSPDTTISIIEV